MTDEFKFYEHENGTALITIHHDPFSKDPDDLIVWYNGSGIHHFKKKDLAKGIQFAHDYRLNIMRINKKKLENQLNQLKSEIKIEEAAIKAI